MQIGNQAGNKYNIYEQGKCRGKQGTGCTKPESQFLMFKDSRKDGENTKKSEQNNKRKNWIPTGTRVRDSLEKKTPSIEKNEGAEMVSEISEKEYAEMLRQQIDELQEKATKGEIEESFKIGAQTFTLEEWNEFLEKFDSVQEILEAMMRQRHAKLEEERKEREKRMDEMEEKELEEEYWKKLQDDELQHTRRSENEH